MMNATETGHNMDLLETIKNSLLQQKSSILNKTSEFRTVQSSLDLAGDEAEIASTDLDNTISIHLHERDIKSLIMIDKALSKIGNGTYGECESCAAEISARRLQARPFTTLCIECMEDLEETKKQKLQ